MAPLVSNIFFQIFYVKSMTMIQASFGSNVGYLNLKASIFLANFPSNHFYVKSKFGLELTLFEISLNFRSFPWNSSLLIWSTISKHHSTSTTFSKNYHFFKRKSGSCTIFLNFEYKYRNIVHPPPFHQNVVEVLWCLLSVESKLHSTFTTFSEKLPKIVKKSKMAVVLWCLLSIESKHHSTTTTFSGNFGYFGILC